MYVCFLNLVLDYSRKIHSEETCSVTISNYIFIYRAGEHRVQYLIPNYNN